MDKVINKQFNLFAKLRENIEDYYTLGIYLVGKPSVKDSFLDPENRGRDGGYYYSQRITLEAIDLACASTYRTGELDSEGKVKTFLNIVNFHADVSINQIGVNTKNYILEPTNNDLAWAVFFMDKKFKEWSDENSYDDIIDELTDDFARKGTCVVKKIKNGVERVPLRTLRNSIRAKSLEEAARNGGYVVIENEMSYGKMSKYKKWKLDGLDRTKTYTVFERYALIPRAKLNEFKGIAVTEADWEDYICAQQILIPNAEAFKTSTKSDNVGGHVCFLEEVQDIPGEFPLEEAHYRKIDGRWLGEGEVEKQLQNQISRNFTANMRRRSLLWAAKKIFQSTDDEVAKNFLIELKDGDVVKVKPNGAVTQINTVTQHSGDFAQDDKAVSENSQKISFSFEAASGEAMPSGTPFRLGAILEAAVSKYFKRKQDTLSNFLKRSFFDQLIPIFKKEMEDGHTLRYEVSDEQYEEALKGMVQVHSNDLLKREWLKSNFVTADFIKAKIEEQLRKSPYIFWTIPDNFYSDIHCFMRLNINEPIGADVETLTTLYQSMAAKNDPRADRVLKAILAKKGQNIDAILGSLPPAPAQPVQNGGATPPADAVPVDNKVVA